jgi:transposase
MHLYYVGLDVHKLTIAYCIKTSAGDIVREGTVKATRAALQEWVKTLPGPWLGAMEATLFSHWIYWQLQPHAAGLAMGHPARMQAISAAKHKTDRLDAQIIADLLRCNLLPECFVMPPELAALRQQMRFRRKLVQQQTAFKNKTANLLMSAGVEYERKKLHGKKYFAELTRDNQWIEEEVEPLLEFCRGQIETLEQMEGRLVKLLERHPQLCERVAALQKLDGVGPITALTWALETGTPERFGSIAKAISYCGLCSGHRESAGKQKRGPLSKQRNAHLQSVLIEAAKLAPMYNEKLKLVRQQAIERGAHANRATLEVARRLVRYLLAADRAWLARTRAAVEPAAAPPAAAAPSHAAA